MPAAKSAPPQNQFLSKKFSTIRLLFLYIARDSSLVLRYKKEHMGDSFVFVQIIRNVTAPEYSYLNFALHLQNSTVFCRLPLTFRSSRVGIKDGALLRGAVATYCTRQRPPLPPKPPCNSATVSSLFIALSRAVLG